MEKVKVTVTVVKSLELTVEEAEFLKESVEEGDRQAFNEITQIDYDSHIGISIGLPL